MARDHRRLAAIVMGDVVGYSRLMRLDESGTLARLGAHRIERLQPALERNSGRLVKANGDDFFVEFGSAVDALTAAVEFQQAMQDTNQWHSDDRSIVFRIGVHLGDIIVEANDLFGDGVNIAARLQAECRPGKILISSAVYEGVRNKLNDSLVYLGIVEPPEPLT